MRDRFAPRLGSGKTCLITEVELLVWLADMERERNRILERLRAYEKQRTKAKLRGQRVAPQSQQQMIEAVGKNSVCEKTAETPIESH